MNATESTAERIERCVERLAKCGHWSADELRSLFISGAMEALFAVETKLMNDNMERASAGQKPKHTDVIALIRSEYESICPVVK